MLGQMTALMDQEFFVFRVHACSDIYITLSKIPQYTQNDAYQIILGAEQNQRSKINKMAPFSETKDFSTPGLLDCATLKNFWVSWTAGHFYVGEGETVNENELFNWRDVNNPYPINALSLGSRGDEVTRWEFLRSAGEWLAEPL